MDLKLYITLALCQPLWAACVCLHVWEGPRVQIIVNDDEISLSEAFWPLSPSRPSRGRINHILGAKVLMIVHHTGPLSTAMRRARLFACMVRPKEPNSCQSRDPRARFFSAFSTLMHIERKIKPYPRGKITQVYALPWPLAERCKLHAYVCMRGEDQGTKFVSLMRSP